MTYTVYKATAPNGKYYIGVTNNFRRRLKEHMTSPYPIGKALRKHGKEKFEFITVSVFHLEMALNIERALITEREVSSDDCYNIALGGTLSDTLRKRNPMFSQKVLDTHPSLFTTTNNPMNNIVSKQKMIHSQRCKKVSIDDAVYYGVREAARVIGESRQCLAYRLRSQNFPTYYYL